MGLFDKLKGLVNAVTGGAATVTIEFDKACVYPGDQLKVKVTATSNGAEVKSKGCFVEILAEETVRVQDDDKKEMTWSNVTASGDCEIAPAFVLAPKETKVFEYTIMIAPHLQPTYYGTLAQHTVKYRGRIEAFGADPASEYKEIKIGAPRG